MATFRLAWTNFLKDYYKSILSITKYHVFSIKDDHPYNIILQEYSRAERESLNICKRPIPEGIFPQQIQAKGLDLERQWYLYEKIRPFCSCTLAGDITCPRPTEPKPTAGALALEHTDVVDGTTEATGTKRPQKPVTCSYARVKATQNEHVPNTHFLFIHLYNVKQSPIIHFTVKLYVK